MDSAQVSLTLKEILLSLADSLIEAEEKLHEMPPYDMLGRPNTSYHLPYLDFSLVLLSEVRKTTPPSGGSPNPTTSGPTKNILQRKSETAILTFTPAVPTAGHTDTTSKIASTISGRFVAVLPNEGLHQMLLAVNAVKKGDALFKVTVNLQLSTGKPVPGQLVEINFDQQSSALLSEVPHFTSTPIFFPSAEGQTNLNGIFETEVKLVDDLLGKTIVLVVNSGSLFKSIAL